MGVVADAVLTAGGTAVGVIPRFLENKELAHRSLTELVVTATMHERKAVMADRADAFAVLPGGFGTGDELFEALELVAARPPRQAGRPARHGRLFRSAIELDGSHGPRALLRPEHRCWCLLRRNRTNCWMRWRNGGRRLRRGSGWTRRAISKGNPDTLLSDCRGAQGRPSPSARSGSKVSALPGRYRSDSWTNEGVSGPRTTTLIPDARAARTKPCSS